MKVECMNNKAINSVQMFSMILSCLVLLGCQAAADATAEIPVSGQPWTNSLGMKFVPAGTDGVSFCIWDVRAQDFQTYVQATGYQQTGGVFIMSPNWELKIDPNASWEHPGF